MWFDCQGLQQLTYTYKNREVGAVQIGYKTFITCTGTCFMQDYFGIKLTPTLSSLFPSSSKNHSCLTNHTLTFIYVFYVFHSKNIQIKKTFDLYGCSMHVNHTLYINRRDAARAAVSAQTTGYNWLGQE